MTKCNGDVVHSRQLMENYAIGGVAYELYRETRCGDDGARHGMIRVYDDSGNVVRIVKYPTFASAEAAYAEAIRIAARTG